MKAGVLLYAMVLAVIFGLVLEAYLQGRGDNARNLKAERAYMTAQLIATLARDRKADSLRTDKGTATADSAGKITVVLTDGSRYNF